MRTPGFRKLWGVAILTTPGSPFTSPSLGEGVGTVLGRALTQPYDMYSSAQRGIAEALSQSRGSQVGQAVQPGCLGVRTIRDQTLSRGQVLQAKRAAQQD